MWEEMLDVIGTKMGDEGGFKKGLVSELGLEAWMGFPQGKCSRKGRPALRRERERRGNESTAGGERGCLREQWVTCMNGICISGGAVGCRPSKKTGTIINFLKNYFIESGWCSHFLQGNCVLHLTHQLNWGHNLLFWVPLYLTLLKVRIVDFDISYDGVGKIRPLIEVKTVV